MILHGNQRGGGKDLALHLMKEENEHVEIHELRGFASDNLFGAFQESYAISRATQCKQHLYSLSLNPPLDAQTSVRAYEAVIQTVEDRLGLQDQPRAIIFHEKRGGDGIVRRHAHAVWCRIDTDQMKAVPLPFTKRKLQDISRELYVEHGWKMPRGFVNTHERDPRNFSLVEWQQAKRAEKDPKKLKILFQERWAISDSKASFAHALEEQGYILAKGDRRGFVAVDHKGEVYAISRWVGVRAKQVRARLGEPDDLPSEQEAHAKAARMVTDRLEELRLEQEREAARKLELFKRKYQWLRNAQRGEQGALRQQHIQRKKAKQASQEARIRKGLFGMLDRITGKRRRTLSRNRTETEAALVLDREEQTLMYVRQENTAQSIQREVITQKVQHETVDSELKKDIQWLKAPPKPDEKAQQAERRKQRQQRNRDGPILER